VCNLKFTKMHGAGNDFLLVDATSQNCDHLVRVAQERAAALCDRRFGVGGDGVIVVSPSTRADFRMRVFNSDGSEPEMCGNGIRCFAKFVHDKGLSSKTQLDVETGAGVLTTHSTLSGGFVSTVEVDMGEAHLDSAEIPVVLPDVKSGPVVSRQLDVAGQEWAITCVSMGNPHCVVFVDDVDAFPLAQIGPQFENHAVFPRRTNTEFVQVISPSEVRMRVWERGAGETLACGTGACAVTVAGSLNGKTGRQVLVHLAGGDLAIHWREDNHVIMTGPAVSVFDGEV